jgi:hypothetical protein
MIKYIILNILRIMEKFDRSRFQGAKLSSLEEKRREAEANLLRN